MENTKIVIGLVGQISSGKGTAAMYLKNKYNIKILRFSTVLRKILKDLNIKESRKNLQNLSTSLRKKFGEDILSKYIAYNINKSKYKIFVVDGIRRKADLKNLKNLKKFKLVKITAPSKIRHKRLVANNENQGDKVKTYKKFLADQKREADAEIPMVMKTADYEIINDKDTKKLFKQIDILINNLQ